MEEDGYITRQVSKHDMRVYNVYLTTKGTALTGAVSHFAFGGAPDLTVLALCVAFTLVWARVAAVLANKSTPKTLNRVTGVILVVLGTVILAVQFLG